MRLQRGPNQVVGFGQVRARAAIWALRLEPSLTCGAVICPMRKNVAASGKSPDASGVEVEFVRRVYEPPVPL
jgi:hypothetical protein